MANCNCNTFPSSLGNVMIGSTAAGAGRLHVVAPSTGTTPALVLEFPTGHNAITLRRGTTVIAEIRKHDDESMVFKSPSTATTRGGFVLKDGNVSIGDTDVASTNYNLEVIGQVQVTGKLVTGDAVGIGTDNPAAGRLLDVNGNVHVRDDIYVEDNMHLLNAGSSIYGENGRRLVDFNGCFYAP